MNEDISFKVLKDQGLIVWNISGAEISIFCQNINQAIISSDKNTIFVLTGEETYPNILEGYNLKGNKIFKTYAPENFTFYYLSDQGEKGTSVVCIGENLINGWQDWRFLINEKTGGLKRYCPAR